jgi:hypothetical protein
VRAVEPSCSLFRHTVITAKDAVGTAASHIGTAPELHGFLIAIIKFFLQFTESNCINPAQKKNAAKQYF